MTEIIDSSIKKAVKGASLVLSGTVVSTLLLIATKILIVRNTTKEELGAYTLTIAIATVFALVATLGVHEGIARFISVLVSSDKRDESDYLSRSAIRITLISSVFANLLLCLFAELLSVHVFNSTEYVRPLRIISFSIPFLVMAQTVNAILRGHGIIASKVYYLDVGIPLFFLVLLCGVFFLNLSLHSILYAYGFSVVLGCLAIGTYGHRKIGLNPLLFQGGRRSGELIRFSIPLLIGVILALIMNWSDILMLGRYAGPKTVGVYEVSSSLSKTLMLPLAALEYVFLPVAGGLHGRGQTRELARTYQVLTKWIFSVTVPIFFMLFAFPEQIVTVLFGDRFLDAVPALRILSCGLLFHGFWGPNGILMVVIGMPREISGVSMFGAVLNVLLNYSLISLFPLGSIGASLATIGTYIALNILVTAIIYYKCKIQPMTRNYGKAIACAIGTGVLVFIMASTFPLHAWLVPVYGLLFIIGYCGSLILSRSIDAEDVSLFHSIVEAARAKGLPLKSSITRVL
jgi:O-antigen/teichoic acid export membrane protein